MKDLDLNQELVHLEEIKEKLDNAVKKECLSLEKQRAELISERKRMWEDSAHNVKDFDDIIDMAAYDERVREEFGHYVRIDETVRQLNYLKKTPYFGRIDFVEDGLDGGEQIYIGRYGFCNKNTYEYFIYDWRTPIANMFYENTLGKAAYKCPVGEITGEITCKRQYQIREGKLEYFYDTNLAVQDELLGKVLSENTDKVLRVIIDTITKEQNHAIRQIGTTDLLIIGPAGSGKTSVGMHRLAYLLYNNRTSLTSDKIAVLSKSQIFSSYISGILPELGEESVQDVLFDELINRGISKAYRKKYYYEQVEYLLEHQADTVRKRGIELKYSQEFWDFVKGIIKKERISKSNADTAIQVYLHCLKKYVCDENQVSELNSAENQQNKYSDSKEKICSDIFEYTYKSLENFQLLYEDLLAVGYIRILLGGIRAMEQISHVVLDEAQDYSILQLMIIKAMFPKSKFTILADSNQAICPEVSTTDTAVFRHIFGKNLKEMTLSKSYRSTAPINQYAFNILGIHNPDLYIDRPGKEPEYVLTDNKVQEITKLIRLISEDKSVGILTCDKDAVLTIKQEMGGKLQDSGRPIEYILKPDRTLEEKIVVMPIMLAKGLEFDVVIVWDNKSQEFWEKNKHLKYLMCTRALHELYFIK